MSSIRSRNKFCLSLDNSSSNTFSNTAHLNRWSEVVPPKTALTFAALWDPEEGMVTFSGAALLDSESLPGRAHPDALEDDYSQFISLDRDMDGGGAADENTATLSTFQDVFKAFLRHTPWDSREHLNPRLGQGAPRGSQTRASSTFDGLDVYSHDVQIKSRRSLQLSCFDLLDTESSFRTSSAFGKLRPKSDLILDSCRSEVQRASSLGSKPSNLDSRFSTTTTSTSNYIDIPARAHQGVRISETVRIPEWTQPIECVSHASSWPLLPRRRRLLRKRRPFDTDTTITAASSVPSTPRKLRSNRSKSSMSSSRSPSSSTATVSPNTTLTTREDRRGRFPRPVGGPISPAPVPAPTPPNSPSKSPRLKLRFTFLQKRKPRLTSSDSDGWVCIEVTPVIRQRFIANLDED